MTWCTFGHKLTRAPAREAPVAGTGAGRPVPGASALLGGPPTRAPRVPGGAQRAGERGRRSPDGDRRTEIAARVRPCAEAVAVLDTLPGLGRRSAELCVAAVGVQRRRFPPAAQLAAGAGLAPGNNASAGTRRPATTRTGSPARGGGRRAALGAAAPAAGRSKSPDVGAQSRPDAGCHARARRARRWPSRTVVAWSWPLMSSRRVSPTATWGPPPSTSATLRPSNAASCTASRRSAPPSHCRPLAQPPTQEIFTSDFHLSL